MVKTKIFVLRNIVTGISAMIAVSFGAMAQAENLAQHWTLPRQEANQLGDAAKAGDEQALLALTAKAAEGDATAMHNLGWLYKSGFAGAPANAETSCNWYHQGADGGYPPAQHGWALCLFAQAKSDGGNDSTEDRAMRLMADAAHSGWTQSAITLAEYLLNMLFLSNSAADEAYEISAVGLKSKPNDQEMVSLLYLVGMSIILRPDEIEGVSNMDRLERFRNAATALGQASEKGHAAATDSLPQSHFLWSNAWLDAQNSWAPPAYSAKKCVAMVSDPNEQQDGPQQCFETFNLSISGLTHLARDVAYLKDHMTDPRRAELINAFSDLEMKSENFRAERNVWEGSFMPRFYERAFSEGWL